MALIVVGGQSRKVGKTSVVVGLISALRECDWLAAKITQHGHEVCTGTGGPCDCVSADHSAAITEERDRSGETDTSRFLVAGAKRALWVRTQEGLLEKAMPQLREEMTKARNVIMESNSVLGFLQPDLYLVVLDPAQEDFKESAREYFDRADAVLMHASEVREDSLKAVEGKPVFRVEPPKYVSEELVEFVREKATLDSRR
jgi:molybdopterin-guanine dinucleotide biosynthesis protein